MQRRKQVVAYWIPFVVLFVVAGIIVFPIAFVWAINELFNLNIAYNFYTWLAALIIIGVLHQGRMMRWYRRMQD